MKKIILLFLLLPLQIFAQNGLKYEQNQTLSYDEVMEAYTRLNIRFPEKCYFTRIGLADNGKPIFAFKIKSQAKDQNSLTVLINNAIHPGEPDGVDASLEFATLILEGKLEYKNLRIVIIPMYNVDGASVQSCCTRANQNGPINQGFRGNARNLDLNRDFIKSDAKNTKAFQELFADENPSIFIDNHVSNGADYQYTMTLITSQPDKLGGKLGKFVRNKMEPELFTRMERRGYPMAPYVNTISHIPDSGIVDFLETPRFATGFATLFNCIAFVPETHMLKPFADRVKATRQLMETICGFATQHADEINTLRKNTIRQQQSQSKFPIAWKVDKSKVSAFSFKGYEAGYKPSEVSGQPRLYYDRSKPFTKNIPYYKTFDATDSAVTPYAFIIPQAWHEVIESLKRCGARSVRLYEDRKLEVLATYIDSYDSPSRPYEGHFLHSNVKISQKKMEIQFYKGDVLFYPSEVNARFLMETLSPTAPDSYFAWNFFDSVLQQKEHYSDYVFEDTAAELLKQNPSLKKQLDEKKRSDPAFASNGAAVLDWIYYHSDYYEKSHRRYPVFQVMDAVQIP